MTKLSWETPGTRIFETGADRGVLFVNDQPGVPWHGLVSVSESPQNTDVTPYYIDGVKYLNVASMKEFSGSIEAFTYPDEFAECDGTLFYHSGLMLDEQPRKEFNLSYRTLIGNDVNGLKHGYKLHIVYNALAVPSDKEFGTTSDDISPGTFSWDFTTTPLIGPRGASRYSHLSIDSTKRRRAFMRAVEALIYGTATTDSKLPSFEELNYIFLNPPVDTLQVSYQRRTGLHPLLEEEDGDFVGRLEDGLYERMSRRIWKHWENPGLYTYGAPIIWGLQVSQDLGTGMSPLLEAEPRDLDWSLFDNLPDGVYTASERSRLVESENASFYTLDAFDPYQIEVTYTPLTGLSPIAIAASGDLEDGPVNDGLFRKSKTSKLKQTFKSGLYNTSGIPITRNLRLLPDKVLGLSDYVTDFVYGDLFDNFDGTGLYPPTEATKLDEIGDMGLYTYGQAPTNQGTLVYSPSTGLNPVFRSDLGDVDMNEIVAGLYNASPFSRLRETSRRGLFSLGAIELDTLAFTPTDTYGVWRLLDSNFGDLARSAYSDNLGIYRRATGNRFIYTDIPGIYRRSYDLDTPMDVYSPDETGIDRLIPNYLAGDLIPAGGVQGIFLRAPSSRLNETGVPGTWKKAPIGGKLVFDIKNPDATGIDLLAVALRGDLLETNVPGVFLRTLYSELQPSSRAGVYQLVVHENDGYRLVEQTDTGFADLVASFNADFEFVMLEDGIYKKLDTSRLKPTAEPGIYDLEN
jgi:hypothetical protein